jgi:hypothetical protein
VTHRQGGCKVGWVSRGTGEHSSGWNSDSLNNSTSGRVDFVKEYGIRLTVSEGSDSITNSESNNVSANDKTSLNELKHATKIKTLGEKINQPGRRELEYF